MIIRRWKQPWMALTSAADSNEYEFASPTLSIGPHHRGYRSPGACWTISWKLSHYSGIFYSEHLRLTAIYIHNFNPRSSLPNPRLNLILTQTDLSWIVQLPILSNDSVSSAWIPIYSFQSPKIWLTSLFRFVEWSSFSLPSLSRTAPLSHSRHHLTISSRTLFSIAVIQTHMVVLFSSSEAKWLDRSRGALFWIVHQPAVVVQFFSKVWNFHCSGRQFLIVGPWVLLLLCMLTITIR
jgi:hypothetical protein